MNEKNRLLFKCSVCGSTEFPKQDVLDGFELIAYD